ncbi:protein sex-lethal-like isoform X2 [Diabrotica undecimpunctata]|uniref:protein sex-lethal-like isoform X2 n=2 Tax=Diabrotica undecimpunctata TaxID=50387 RepID=UPI003B635CA1
MFSTQLGNFPFANTRNIQETTSNSLNNNMMDANNGAGDRNDGSIDKTKLIVNYIPQYATEGELTQIFSTIGKLEDVKIMRDFKTGYSFGFGFVKYSTEEEAAKAITVLNGYNLMNKRLKVSYSRPPGTGMKDSNLYITNLPKNITEQEIDNIFSKFGEIVQRTLLKDKITGMPRGVAFVRFARGEEAQAAISGLHGTTLADSMLPLSVRVAEDHGRQKAQYVDVWDPMGFNREPEESFTFGDEGPDLEEILIAEVSYRRPLWDLTIHSSKMEIEHLWEQIYRVFKKKYSINFLTNMWSNLKENYIKEKRSFNNSVEFSAKPFPYYYQMKFLDEFENAALCGSSRKHSRSPLRKKVKTDDKASSTDGVDEFLLQLGEGLRKLPTEKRTKLQIRFVELLKDEESDTSD